MDIETENHMLEQEVAKLRADLRKVNMLLEQEQEDYRSLASAANAEGDKLRSLLYIARCMMDRKEADLLTNHAEMLGINLYGE